VFLGKPRPGLLPDLRSRILSAVDQGKSGVEIVATFQVSQATITRYRKLLRETGTLATKPIRGRSPKKRVALQAGLSTQLATHPDATLDEHCRMWEAEHGMKVSSATMSRAIKCLHGTRKKKTLSASEQNNEARAAWRESVSDLKSNQLVFIDEGIACYVLQVAVLAT
jgi:transposase